MCQYEVDHFNFFDHFALTRDLQLVSAVCRPEILRGDKLLSNTLIAAIFIFVARKPRSFLYFLYSFMYYSVPSRTELNLTR